MKPTISTDGSVGQEKMKPTISTNGSVVGPLDVGTHGFDVGVGVPGGQGALLEFRITICRISDDGHYIVEIDLQWWDK
jgi:hypothetical protein